MTIETDKKVAFLKQPESYPEQPAEVEAIETHMSWVFLTDQFAYKLKKPLRWKELDFSTLEARRHDSEQEVTLNRRLAGDVYIGTVALTLKDNQQLRLGSNGQPVDWLVKMRRLPRSQFLEQLILRGTVQRSDVQKIARHLADFYKKAPSLQVGKYWYRRHFTSNIRHMLHWLSRSSYPVPLQLAHEVADAQLQFVEDHAQLLDRRVLNGCIVDGHGDLRPGHICLTPEPVIFDCLEFNPKLRIVDAVDELAFLAMECRRLDSFFVKEVLFDTYGQITGDYPPTALVGFYESFRACQRAYLAVRHTIVPKTLDQSKWSKRAEQYLVLARRSLRSR